MSRPSRSGTQYTEAQRRERGEASVKLRLDAAAKERLDRLAADEGRSKSELVEVWIEQAWAERAKP